MRFAHLHAHSHYSLLSGTANIPDLVKTAKRSGMEALALTDSGNLYGAIEFYKTCQKEGLKPIIGIDAYVALRTRFDKETGIDSPRARLVLLAENETGYRNLLKLVTASHLEGFFEKPRIDRELMERHKEGLVALLPSLAGEVALALKAKDGERAGALLDEYRAIFGANLYAEVSRHAELEGHDEAMEQLVALARAKGVPLVAGRDIYYLAPEDKRVRDTLLSIENASVRGRSGFSDDDADLSFVDTAVMEELFADLPEAIENAGKLAERCSLDLKLGVWVFPNLPLTKGSTYDDELRKLVEAGIEKRGLDTSDKTLRERIEYELGIIKQKGYSPYFLVVADLLHFAHESGILTTIRGSVAGSLVTYLSGITNINPLLYRLPFERFLNPERPSAPDIDMDFADNRRDEMIEYAKRTYGEDKVAQIGTFGTMMARGSVRDVARALGYPYGLGDRIAKLIPFGSQGFPMTIDRALEETPDLKELYKKDKQVKEVIDLAKKIEGNARHISIHAAGVVISPTPLTDFVPLQLDPKGGKIVTQYDMHAVEDAGLLKFDFLGIRNLAILAHSVRLVRKIRGVSIDIENIPMDDRKTFEMLARGETMGLFQLNGSGMTRFLKELKPSSIHDINAMVALYRPGPMESIPSYIERKHNPSLVTYLDPRMKDILAESHGVITYQDDVLLIAINIAGYSWLEADKLRKAMGKKIPAEMEAQKEKLIAGAVEHGLAKEKAEKLWKLIEPFAAYGFNKAHAASYGRVAYQTAYMKANHPLEYMAAVLTAEGGDVEEIARIVAECKRMGIPVLPPSVNESFSDFTVVENTTGGAIRFGLRSIKNFGEGIADAIIEERKEGGPFASLGDFLFRVRAKNLNRRSLESLIRCGALDAFGKRGSMLANIELMLSFNREASNTPEAQDSLFGAGSGATPTLTLPEAPEAPIAECLEWEKELLGLYVSGHPLDAYQEKLKNRGMVIEEVRSKLREGMQGVVAGILEEIRPIVTKGGDRMAFAKLADESGKIEIVFFPRLYGEQTQLLAPNRCIAVKGRLSMRNGEASIVADAVKAL